MQNQFVMEEYKSEKKTKIQLINSIIKGRKNYTDKEKERHEGI
mgnify:CR=1 FL=1